MYAKYLDFLNKPVEEEYFTRFVRIYSKDNNGNAVKISLNQKNLEPTEYCDKIKIGETLETALKRSLKDDFGLDLVDFDILVFFLDTAKNKHGQSVTRIPVIVYVKYNLLKIKELVGCDVSWIKRENEALVWINGKNDISRLISNGIGKENLIDFINKVYIAGAIDVFIDRLEELDELLNIGIGIRLPKEKSSRQEIFELFNSEQKMKKIKTSIREESDDDQKFITLWLD